MVTRGCDQCGTAFKPRREHARFCSPGCRVGWNRDHLTDAAAEERALEWSLTGMQDVVEKLALDRPADHSAASGAVAEAVWWITIIDARLIRQYMDIYDAVLAARPPAQHPMIEGTLAGLRFVRNQMGEDLQQAGFIKAPTAAGDGEAVTGAWRWTRWPKPDLSLQPAHVQAWELTRFQAYEQWLAEMTVGCVFERAAGFLSLAAGRAVSSTLASLR